MKELLKSLRRPFFIGIPLLLLLTLLINQCWVYKFNNSYINPPSADYDIPYEEFLINADSFTNIYTKTGTHLEIPSNAFEDSAGHQVTGVINLKVREFHTPMEILRAGIPLRINRGKDDFLESGGMIEIKANKDNAKLKIRAGSSMGIDLAAFKKSTNYQLFNLTESGNWSIEDSFKVIPNERKNKIIQSLFSKLSTTRIEKSSDIIFELFSDLDISPEMEPWLGQKWLIKAKNVTSHVKQALRINWDSLSITKQRNGDYLLEFHKEITYYDSDKKDEQRSFSVVAKPYNPLSKSEDKEFSFDEKLVKVDSIKNEIQAEIARVKQEAEYLNSFRIKNMGIWNIDKIAKIDQYIPIFATFDFLKELKSINKIRLFCIYEDANSVLEIDLDEKNPIYVGANGRTKIVAILSGKQVRIVDSEYIKNLNLKPNSKIVLQSKSINKDEFFNISP